MGSFYLSFVHGKQGCSIGCIYWKGETLVWCDGSAGTRRFRLRVFLGRVRQIGGPAGQPCGKTGSSVGCFLALAGFADGTSVLWMPEAGLGLWRCSWAGVRRASFGILPAWRILGRLIILRS